MERGEFDLGPRLDSGFAERRRERSFRIEEIGGQVQAGASERIPDRQIGSSGRGHAMFAGEIGVLVRGERRAEKMGNQGEIGRQPALLLVPERNGEREA